MATFGDTNQQDRAANWFTQLRDEIVAGFEQVEVAQYSADQGDLPAGRFKVTETRRDGGQSGGGAMSVMKCGRVFEKVGVNISTVWGELGEKAQAAMASRRGGKMPEKDARFWASGISLVAHMQNPHVPAVHMNTRLFCTPAGWWFGGGSDLNPAIEYHTDTAEFHGVLQACCDQHDPEYYPRFKAWADRYFFVPHRHRARGVGGIFFDDLNTGDWEADFAFTRDVGRALLPAYLPLLKRRCRTPFADTDRTAQLVHRGLYTEYNLLYDRGTRFGLESGHDPDAVLMSLPPLAKWE